MESNDIPEIPDRGETSERPGLPSVLGRGEGSEGLGREGGVLGNKEGQGSDDRVVKTLHL